MSAQAETVTPVAEAPKDEGFRVYLGNLSFKTTEEEIREFAGSVGEILTVVIPRRLKRPSGFAFVHYKTEDSANAAVEKLNDTELGGRKIAIQNARSREEQASRREEILEKRKVAREAKDAAAEEKKAEKAKEAEANGETAQPKKKASKRSSRRRQPGQEDEEEAETGVEVTGEADKPKKKRNPRKPKAKTAETARIDGAENASEEAPKEKKPKQKKAREPRLQLTGEQSPNTIFVANLPFDLDDDALSAIFTNLSIKVKSANVVKGIRRARGGNAFRASRGFGFVELEDPSQQKEAVEKVDGTTVGERQISAKIANEMKPIEQAETAAEPAASA